MHAVGLNHVPACPDMLLVLRQREGEGGGTDRGREGVRGRRKGGREPGGRDGREGGNKREREGAWREGRVYEGR